MILRQSCLRQDDMIWQSLSAYFVKVSRDQITYSSTSFQGSNLLCDWWAVFFRCLSYFSRLLWISLTAESGNFKRIFPFLKGQKLQSKQMYFLHSLTFKKKDISTQILIRLQSWWVISIIETRGQITEISSIQTRAVKTT